MLRNFLRGICSLKPVGVPLEIVSSFYIGKAWEFDIYKGSKAVKWSYFWGYILIFLIPYR